MGTVGVESLLLASGVPSALLVYLIMRFKIMEGKIENLENKYEHRISTVERFVGLHGMRLARRRDDPPPPTGDHPERGKNAESD